MVCIVQCLVDDSMFPWGSHRFRKHREEARESLQELKIKLRVSDCLEQHDYI